MSDNTLQRMRWRLILGKESENALGFELGETERRQDEALDFLYRREYSGKRNVRGSKGGLGDSMLTVPDWINRVHELFPKKTIERIEKDALERYKIDEMVTNPELLQRAKPSQTVLRAVLQTKHLMNQEVLTVAKILVRNVVEQLAEKFSRTIRNAFSGTLDRQRRSMLKVAKNFNAKSTIRRNLGRYDPETKKILIETPFFHSRIRRQSDRYQLIIVVDQSGSMVDSVIHAAVCASVFFGLKSLRTHLIAFDTNIVDLSNDCADPVETLMKVQLGGGTDIGQALAYASSLIEIPRRAVVVLITDFYEGGPVGRLLSTTKSIVESGATLLGLAALDEEANPNYDRSIAEKMVVLGAHCGAMTPGELADWVAAKIN